MSETKLDLLDHEPKTDQFVDEVVELLNQDPPQLPCKLLYDEEGSRLYDEITRLVDYYPTRTEAKILSRSINDIAEAVGEKAVLIEYGSGSSEKTRTLLSNIEWKAYVPIDISREHLINSSESISEDYPSLDVYPVCADYGEHFDLPEVANKSTHRVVFFPGSTIGNFHPEEAVDFLRRIHEVCGPAGKLLIGVDIPKSKETLERAYDDSEGVTAQFNINILNHLNREVGSDFDTEQFEHRAVYEPGKHRVEMHLVSKAQQKVTVGDSEIELDEGDHIWTESSYKYPPDVFADIARKAGFNIEHVWRDENDLFSVQLLSPIHE